MDPPILSNPDKIRAQETYQVMLVHRLVGVTNTWYTNIFFSGKYTCNIHISGNLVAAEQDMHGASCIVHSFETVLFPSEMFA
jgi:hypothetical protein